MSAAGPSRFPDEVDPIFLDKVEQVLARAL
jgi:hypothetical protein